MNKKLIKTIASITCGLGLIASIPFVSTSCGCSPKKPDQPTQTLKIIAPDEYLDNKINIVSNDEEFPSSLLLNAEISHNILDDNIKWEKTNDTTPNKVITIDQYGEVKLSKPIDVKEQTNYSFTIKATLKSNESITGSATFELNVDKVKPIPTSGDNSWLTYSDDKKTITGVSNKWNTAEDPLSNYNTLEISNSITAINDDVFSGGSTWDIGKISGDNVKIRLKFEKNSSLKSIGRMAFVNCVGLVGSLILPDSLNEINDAAFLGCSGFNGKLILPNSITSIGVQEFKDCSNFKGDLIIPDSVTSINNQAFQNCSKMLGKLTLPSSLNTLGDYPFSGCLFKELTNTGKIGNLGSIIQLGGAKGLFTSTTTDWDDTFDNNSTVVKEIIYGENLVIPNNITSIHDDAFVGCFGLKGELTLPSSLKTLGKEAFYQCYNINGSITLPASLTSIGDYPFVFTKISGLNNEIGAQICGKYIVKLGGVKCLLNTENFTNDSEVYSEVAFGENLKIPDGITKINDCTFSQCTGISGTLTLPSSLAKVGITAFNFCEKINAIISHFDNAPTVGAFSFGNLANIGSLKNLGDVDSNTILTKLKNDGNLPNDWYVNE